jgi:two-component system chemotaxis response regulator CheY
MRVLVVEDDFTSRKLMQKLLQSYGECDLAENGTDAIAAFQRAWKERRPYDLICLDIMMPGMNGHEVLETIRQIEDGRGIHGREGVKIIMTTALDDRKNIMQAFRYQCEAYLIKPIDRHKLANEIRKFGLIQDET